MELLKLNFRIVLSNDNKRLSDVLTRTPKYGAYFIYGTERH